MAVNTEVRGRQEMLTLKKLRARGVRITPRARAVRTRLGPKLWDSIKRII